MSLSLSLSLSVCVCVWVCDTYIALKLHSSMGQRQTMRNVTIALPRVMIWGVAGGQGGSERREMQ